MPWVVACYAMTHLMCHLLFVACRKSCTSERWLLAMLNRNGFWLRSGMVGVSKEGKLVQQSGAHWIVRGEPDGKEKGKYWYQ